MKTQINYLILIDFLLISILLIISSFLYLENRIYKVNYEMLPGDCGQFVIYMSAAFFDKNITIEELSLETNPFKLFTGPLTIRNELKKLNIKTTFYNNLSVQEIKEKLDEKKLVIIMINVNITRFVDTGLTHYIFVFDYKQENDSLKGFYFFDTYYFINQYVINSSLEPIYISVEELEQKRQNIMRPNQFVGKIQNAIGMHKFTIIVDEAGQDRGINKKMMNAFTYQYYAEKIAAFVGKIVMKISKRV